MSNYKNKYANRLRTRIGELRLTQVEFCKRLNIPTNKMTHYLNGGLPRSMEEIEALAHGIGKSIDWLLTGKDSTSTNHVDGFLCQEDRELLGDYHDAGEEARYMAKIALYNHRREQKTAMLAEIRKNLDKARDQLIMLRGKGE